MSEIISALEIRLLNIEIYSHWMTTTPEYALVKYSSPRASYFRRSNSDAASDLIRVELLLDQGGICIDYDDFFPWLHDPTRTNPKDGKLVLQDNKSTLAFITPSRSTLSPLPPGHPFLKYYRHKFLSNYEIRPSSATAMSGSTKPNQKANNDSWADPRLPNGSISPAART